MPELPEVETVMRGLQERLQGHVIVRASVNRADLRWPFPAGLAARLTGARVLSFRRRAKYILMRLDGDVSMLLHLGMSGRIVIGRTLPNIETPHEHITLETEDGWRVAFIDPRRFGSVDLIETAAEDSHKLLAELGPEPLDDAFNAAALSAALAGRSAPIKAALLDQTTVAGLGNIYVCEALFRARISPKRLARERGRRARRAAGARDQGGPDRSHRGRRLQSARLRAARRRTRLFPARLESLWSRRRAMRALSGCARMRRRQPHRAVRAQHLLLPAHAALARTRLPHHGECRWPPPK